jgi:hypothetical protein
MEMLAKLCAADSQLLLATPFQMVNLDDSESCAEAVIWWTEMTSRGGEGMVVKPLNFIAEGRRGITQPAIKCRGPEYHQAPGSAQVQIRNAFPKFAMICLKSLISLVWPRRVQ